MLSLVVGVITGILGFFDSILPASPFRALIDSWGSLGEGIGWLNWLVPVGVLLTILGAWLSLMVIWYGVVIVMRRAKEVTGGKAHD